MGPAVAPGVDAKHLPSPRIVTTEAQGLLPLSSLDQLASISIAILCHCILLVN